MESRSSVLTAAQNIVIRKIQNMDLTKLGGRKFFFGMSLLALAFILQLLDKETGQFVAIAGIIYGTYVAGNVIQKGIQK